MRQQFSYIKQLIHNRFTVFLSLAMILMLAPAFAGNGETPSDFTSITEAGEPSPQLAQANLSIRRRANLNFGNFGSVQPPCHVPPCCRVSGTGGRMFND